MCAFQHSQGSQKQSQVWLFTLLKPGRRLLLQCKMHADHENTYKGGHLVKQ